MLKRKVMPVVFVISVFLCTFEVPSAATNCEQAFTFFGFTRAESPSSEHGIFWIGEDVGGECYGSYLIQVYVQEQGIYTSRTLLTEYGEWNWLREDIKHLSRQPFEQLVEKDGVWRCSACTFSVKDPAPDSALARLLKKAFREGGERTWTRDHGVEGILQPLFDGCYTTLTYYYDWGLYVGYQISKAYYFPWSNHVLIFTNQPMLVSGLDTMHGFLIFKVKE